MRRDVVSQTCLGEVMNAHKVFFAVKCHEPSGQCAIEDCGIIAFVVGVPGHVLAVEA